MEIQYELRPFNIRVLTSNGTTTRVLFESKYSNFTCEIQGPQQSQTQVCEFKVQIEDELIKRDIQNLLQYIVLSETYQKQQFTIQFDGEVKYCPAINSLFKAMITHNIRMKDSFAACSSQFKDNLFIDQEEYDMQIIYSLYSKKIICMHMKTIDHYSDLISGCVSGCELLLS
ncbi:hypothetical protein pb186bvf_008754 [Paramecium bursaria]